VGLCKGIGNVAVDIRGTCKRARARVTPEE